MNFFIRALKYVSVKFAYQIYKNASLSPKTFVKVDKNGTSAH
jgi:hypothetical protein